LKNIAIDGERDDDSPASVLIVWFHDAECH